MQKSNLYLGGLIVLAGVLLLLQNLGLITGVEHFAWAILFGLGGLAFLATFLYKRDNWWAAIPGSALLSLAALIVLGDLYPNLDNWGGTVFLGGLSLGFWAVYLSQRAQWWALIPGGVLLTLAAVAGAEPFLPGTSSGGIFFLGLGVTFGLLYLLPTPGERMNWALIPCAILLIMGSFLMAAAVGLLKFVGPGALILIGIYLLYRTSRKQ